jgi:hypothetical protein
MPSMPLYFWNDEGGRRYFESYFDTFPGPPNVWRHGDWLKLIQRPESVTGVVYGRSDSTINRHGIRMGTSELYRVVEEFDEVLDSLVIDLEYLGRESYMALFVVLREPGADVSPGAASGAARRDPHQAVGASCAQRRGRDARGAAHHLRQEAGGADQAHPARPAGRTIGEQGFDGQPGHSRVVRGLCAGARRAAGLIPAGDPGLDRRRRLADHEAL